MVVYSINTPLQWNLSIADMLYSGHLSIADTFSWNQLSLALVKSSYFEPLYSRHLSIADTISENNGVRYWEVLLYLLMLSKII